MRVDDSGSIDELIRMTGRLTAELTNDVHFGIVLDAKASGLVNRMIETLALQGVRVAPPETLSKVNR
jgi:hypothetical protein